MNDMKCGEGSEYNASGNLEKSGRWDESGQFVVESKVSEQSERA